MGNFSLKEKYLKFFIYSIVIVLINIVGITLFFRLDLTRDKIYSLSDASKTVARTLSEPLTIKVFFSKNLPAPHNNTERYLRDLLEEYAAQGGKYFNYFFYDVTPDEGTSTQTADENRKMAEDYGIQPVQIQIMENDEIKFKNAYMGLVIINGDLVERFGAITSTNNLEYYLTTAIQKMNSKISALLNLKEKVHVDMYLSASLNTIAPLIGLDQLPMMGKKIQETIEDLNHKSLGVIEFNHIDMSDREQLKEIETKYNITPLTWPDFPQEQITAGQGAAEILIRYKDQTTTIPLISSAKHPLFQTIVYQMADPSDLEEQVNSVIEKLIGINMEIGFLAGFGAHSLVPDQMAMMQGRPAGGMQTLNALISKRYAIKPVDLKDFRIPDGMSCLMITRPTEKFSDYELFQIDQALMKGTNIAYITDAFNENSSQQGNMGMPPQFVPIDTGLEKLFNHYGVEIQKAYILDKQAYV
ncbi:MAG: GldG family protein, partial [Proteobacteria bacterium]|nr:GldG family protein [Pseudomonadota bacterium]